MGVQSVSEKSGIRSSVSVDDFSDDEQPSREDVREGKFVPKYMDENGVANDFVMVGHGVVTSPSTCGKVRGRKGCLNVEGHNYVSLDGVNYAGKVFWKKVRFSCYKPSCPVCYDGGWAFRGAGKIEARLKEGFKHFGLAEHVVVSVPVSDNHLSFKALRRKAIKVAKKRGIVGGSIIPHGFRYRKYAYTRKGIYYPKGWYFSPHFHFIGFVLGGGILVVGIVRESQIVTQAVTVLIQERGSCSIKTAGT